MNLPLCSRVQAPSRRHLLSFQSRATPAFPQPSLFCIHLVTTPPSPFLSRASPKLSQQATPCPTLTHLEILGRSSRPCSVPRLVVIPSAYVLREILQRRQIFCRAGPNGAALLQRFASRLLRSPRSQKDAFAQIAQLLKRGIRSAPIFVHLLHKIVEKPLGKSIRVRDVAACVFVDGLLTPGIKLLRVKTVGFVKKDLGCGYHHAHNWPGRRPHHPNRDRVIRRRPE